MPTTLSLAIVYTSGYGHTERVARAVADGVGKVPGAKVTLLNLGSLDDAGWLALDDADAIIFGAPTYMGGVSAKFKEFCDSTSKRWMAQTWKNKIAAGFTNAGYTGGDSLNALYQLMIFAMQHSMIWVGNGTMPAKGINRMGAFTGLMTQSENAPPELTPPPEDIETAKLFGERVAILALQFTRSRLLSD